MLGRFFFDLNARFAFLNKQRDHNNMKNMKKQDSISSGSSHHTLAPERDPQTQKVIEELKRVYKTKVLPLEQTYRYDMFNQPFMSDAEFDSKPQVLLVGQYSVGKTSFIRYLLGRDFPGQRIGPEPTTDRFVAVMDGQDERIIPGNALAVSHDLPFRGLERFGIFIITIFDD